MSETRPVCTACGARLLPDAAFCGACGRAVEPAVAGDSPEATPDPLRPRGHRRWLVAGVAIASVVVLAACAAGVLLVVDPFASDHSSAAVVGAEGGTVALEGGGQIVFPPDAVSETTTVEASVVPAAEVPPGPPFEAQPAGEVYRVTVPGGLGAPVSLTLPFDKDVADDEVIFVGRYDETTGAWHPMLGVVDRGAGTITVQVEGFSFFGAFKESAADFAAQIGGAMNAAAEGVLWVAGLSTAEGPICANPHPKEVERIDFGVSLTACIEEHDATTVALHVVNNRPYGQLVSLPTGASIVQVDRGGFWDRIWDSVQPALGGDLYLPPGARVIVSLPAGGTGEARIEGSPSGVTLALDVASGVALDFFPAQIELLVPFMECVVAAHHRSTPPEGGQLEDLAATIRDCLNSGAFDEYLPNLGPYWHLAVEAVRGTVIGTHLGDDMADGPSYVAVQYRAAEVVDEVDGAGVVGVASVLELSGEYPRRYEYAVYSTTGELIGQVRGRELQRSASWDINDAYLAISYEDEVDVHALDGTLVTTLRLGGWIAAPVLGPADSHLVAVATNGFDRSNPLRVFDVRSGAEAWSVNLEDFGLPAYEGPYPIGWAADGQRVIGTFTLGSEFEPEVWSASASDVSVVVPAGRNRSFSPDGHLLVHSAWACGEFGGFAFAAEVIDPSDGDSLRTLIWPGYATWIGWEWSLSGSRVIGGRVALGPGGTCPPDVSEIEWEIEYGVIDVLTGEWTPYGSGEEAVRSLDTTGPVAFECEQETARCDLRIGDRSFTGLDDAEVRLTSGRAGRAGAPVETAPSLLPTIGASVTVVGTGDCLRIRSAPTTSSARLDCLDDGTRAIVEDGPVSADDYTWYRLKGHGWMAGEFLATDAVLEVLEAIEQQDTAFLVERQERVLTPCSKVSEFAPFCVHGLPEGYEIWSYPVGEGCLVRWFDTPEDAVAYFMASVISHDRDIDEITIGGVIGEAAAVDPGHARIQFRALPTPSYVSVYAADVHDSGVVVLSASGNC